MPRIAVVVSSSNCRSKIFDKSMRADKGLVLEAVASVVAIVYDLL